MGVSLAAIELGGLDMAFPPSPVVFVDEDDLDDDGNGEVVVEDDDDGVVVVEDDDDNGEVVVEDDDDREVVVEDDDDGEVEVEDDYDGEVVVEDDGDALERVVGDDDALSTVRVTKAAMNLQWSNATRETCRRRRQYHRFCITSNFVPV